MERAGRFILVVAAMCAGTWFAGWWTVPVVAAAWAVADRGDRALPLRAGLAGITAWGLLLAGQLGVADLGRLAEVVGRVLGVGAGPVVVLTLVFPALLAASAASVVRAAIGTAPGAP